MTNASENDILPSQSAAVEDVEMTFFYSTTSAENGFDDIVVTSTDGTVLKQSSSKDIIPSAATKIAETSSPRSM